jgi:YfiH family protein
MLQRRTSPTNAVVYYASPLLESIGVRHAFSTRIGGLSPAPFDSLNLGNPNGCSIQDDRNRIAQNYALLNEAINIPGSMPLWVHQMHGCGVESVPTNEPFDVGRPADAMISQDPHRPISVRVADCVPILISTADGKTVAAVHAGWKGIIAGVIAQTIEKMIPLSATNPQNFRAAIGPCISFEAFEVGQEVLGKFSQAFGKDAPIESRADGKGRVDLRQSARLQLLAAGLSQDKIDTTDRCTVEHREEFFSHRRDQGVTGRMSAVILPAS